MTVRIVPSPTLRRTRASFTAAALCSATACVILCATGCRGSKDTPAAKSASDRAPEAAVTNRVDIGPTVRRNLGITFAPVERRAVARTLRVPARVELPPSARREERAPTAGVVEVLVREFQPVRRGEPLFRLQSPRWRELQQQLAETEAALRIAETEVSSLKPLMLAHAHHEEGLRETIALRSARVEQLEQLVEAGGAPGGELAEARVQLAKARSDLAETGEKEAMLEARGVDAAARLTSAKVNLDLQLAAAAALTGETVAALTASVDNRPRWQSIAALERTAPFDGVVSHIDLVSGAQVEASAPILDLVDPGQVQVRAALLQNDLARLPAGAVARALAPTGSGAGDAVDGSQGADGGGAGRAHALVGSLIVAPQADAERRTIDVILVPAAGTTPPPWARPGVSTMMELTLDGHDEPELAIPLRAVVRDGASAYIFRRDPRNPDSAVRIEADLGVDDGRFVAVLSGLRDGDEVIVDGAYQLMVATSSSMPKGGHFHSDGTFHAGPEDH